MTKILRTIKEIKDFIEKDSTVLKFRATENSFTRDSKLGFHKTVLLGISRMTKSLDAELYNRLTDNDLEYVIALPKRAEVIKKQNLQSF